MAKPKVAEAMRRRWADPVWREKMLGVLARGNEARSRKMAADPGFRARTAGTAAETLRRQWADEGFREKQRIAVSESNRRRVNHEEQR